MTRLRVLAAFLFAGASALAFAPAHAANLITNGDFSSGNTGFTTGYTYVPPGPNAVYPEGLYTIAADPHSVHQYWVDVSGSTPMMLVNGAISGSPVVWEEDNITTPTAGTYDFSANVMNVCCNNTFSGPNASSMLNFQVSLDGGAHWINLASYISTASDAGVMHLLKGVFSSISNGKFDLRVTDGSNLLSGNDFALADITVASAVPEPATWTMLILGVAMIGFAARRRGVGSAAAA